MKSIQIILANQKNHYPFKHQMMKKKKHHILHTVNPRLEAHMDMTLFEVFLKSIDSIPQQKIFQRHYSYYR